MRRKVLLWLLAIVITLASAVYQRLTGPTYPVSVDAEFAGCRVRGELLRSHSTGGDLPVELDVDCDDATGVVRWRRFPSDGPWTETPLARDATGALAARLPAQPSAGKLEYAVRLTRGDEVLEVTGPEAVVARFKGDVPPWALAPHILLMFLAMLWSNRTGLEAAFGGPGRARMALWTLGLLGLGGLVFGPIVQKYAFGAYWTGWPLGGDLTDNKLAAAVLAWAWAAWRKDTRWGRATAIIAALVVLAVYMIPHSMHGSTLDYSTMETISG